MIALGARSVRRPAATDARAQARFVGVSGDRTASRAAARHGSALPARGRWLLAGIGAALLGVVAFAGIASQAGPAAAVQSTGSSDVAGALLGGAAGGPNLFDLGWKTVLVLVLLAVTLRVLRRVQHGPAAAGSRLVVLESRALAPKASLHLLAIGERRLVVGLTAGGMVSLAELDAADLPEPGRVKSEDSTVATVPARLLPAASSGLDRRIVQVLSAALGSGR